MLFSYKRAAKHAALPMAVCAATLGVVMALPASAQAQQAQRVSKDPETGQIRAPELDEMSAERAAPAVAPSAARAAASTSAKPVAGVRVGARGFRVDSSRMVSSVVSRNADGTLSTQCVTGEAALDKALHGAVVGGAHDH